MVTWVIALGGPLGILATAWVAWSLGSRKEKREDRQDQGAALWAAANDIREAYLAEFKRQNTKIAGLELQVSKCNDDAKAEIAVLWKRFSTLEAELRRVKKRVTPAKKAVAKKRATR